MSYGDGMEEESKGSLWKVASIVILITVVLGAGIAYADYMGVSIAWWVPGDNPIQTAPASEVGKDSVTFNGILGDMMGDEEVTVWFEWGLNGSSFIFKTENQTLIAIGNFSQKVKSPFFYSNKDYKYRAVGSFSGTEYGETECFTIGNATEVIDKDFSQYYDEIEITNISVERVSDSITSVFTGAMGDLFWVFLLGMPFLLIWLRGSSTFIPGIIGLIAAGAIWSSFPPAFANMSYILMVISFAGLLYGIFKKKGGG